MVTAKEKSKPKAKSRAAAAAAGSDADEKVQLDQYEDIILALTADDDGVTTEATSAVTPTSGALQQTSGEKPEESKKPSRKANSKVASKVAQKKRNEKRESSVDSVDTIVSSNRNKSSTEKPGGRNSSSTLPKTKNPSANNNDDVVVDGDAMKSTNVGDRRSSRQHFRKLGSSRQVTTGRPAAAAAAAAAASAVNTGGGQRAAGTQRRVNAPSQVESPTTSGARGPTKENTKKRETTAAATSSSTTAGRPTSSDAPEQQQQQQQQHDSLASAAATAAFAAFADFPDDDDVDTTNTTEETTSHEGDDLEFGGSGSDSDDSSCDSDDSSYDSDDSDDSSCFLPPTEALMRRTTTMTTVTAGSVSSEEAHEAAFEMFEAPVMTMDQYNEMLQRNDRPDEELGRQSSKSKGKAGKGKKRKKEKGDGGRFKRLWYLLFGLAVGIVLVSIAVGVVLLTMRSRNRGSNDNASSSVKGGNPRPNHGKSNIFVKENTTFERGGHQNISVYNGHHYILSKERKTWDEAHELAQSITSCGQPGHLVHIETEAENEFVLSFSRYTSRIWTGGSTDQSGSNAVYRWTDGSEIGSFRPWWSRHPDLIEGIRGCIVVRFDAKGGPRGGWTDASCETAIRPFLIEFDCKQEEKEEDQQQLAVLLDSSPSPPTPSPAGEKGPAMYEYQGHLYHSHREQELTFLEAQKYAASMSYCDKPGHLVHIGDAGENNFVLALSLGYGKAWIGGSTTGFGDDVYRWTDGSVVSTEYFPWADDAPKYTAIAGIRTCLQLNGVNKPGWSDHFCDKTKGFIVEFDCDIDP